MGLRTAHGTGAPALLRAETLPAEELPAGVPVERPDPLHADGGPERGPDGRWLKGARRSQTAGGLSKRGKAALASRLGLGPSPEGDAFTPYRRAAATFRRVQCAELARTVGGGVCGPGPSSIVASAALALAWSRYLSDQAARKGDGDLAIKAIRMSESSRQALLTAHELCAREATARRAQRGPVDPLASWQAALPATTTASVVEPSGPVQTESGADAAAGSTIESSEVPR